MRRERESKTEAPRDLEGAAKDRYLDGAYRIIAEDGLESLSIREVARRLGVSHQAPYKHFASRDHILAGVVARTYGEFSRHLEARPRCDDPERDLYNMGIAYLAYAKANPLKYRLMFGTPLPAPDRFPDMMEEAHRAFDILRKRLSSMPRRPLGDGGNEETDAGRDAMFVWSALHGFAGIAASDAVSSLGMSGDELAHAQARLMQRIGVGLLPS
jgi:AcrR family transcriptional regulator